MSICEACKEVFEQGETIKCLGHIGGTATCTEQALCERCSQHYGDLLPHSYTSLNDSVCTVCGYSKALNTPQTPEQSPSQDDVQESTQSNTQSPTQNSANSTEPSNTQKPVEDDKQNIVLDNTNQNSEQKPVQNDTQSTEKPKTSLIIAGVAITSGIALASVYIFKKKRIIK